MSLGLSANHRLPVIALLQAVMYASVWLWNEYVATYITIIFPVMILLILLLSVIADWIEPSRIPGWYYQLMIISVVIPILIGAIFYFIYGGKLDFMTQ